MLLAGEEEGASVLRMGLAFEDAPIVDGSPIADGFFKMGCCRRDLGKMEMGCPPLLPDLDRGRETLPLVRGDVVVELPPLPRMGTTKSLP
ncbi:hypothetical protein ACLOJK_029810 [Asimina triloba]